ncbi:hypothetical protein G9A89_020534 [Geosiphon pyriformis]|nr:hypothetical protein G9A89_020534 [Geosiphon pyriformis]
MTSKRPKKIITKHILGKPLSTIDFGGISNNGILIACPVFFGGVSWAKIAGGAFFPLLSTYNGLTNAGFSPEIKSSLLVVNELELCLVSIESSLTSLTRQISKLVKRLKLLILVVSQSSSECQLLVTLLSQDQMGNIIIKEDLAKATSGKTIMVLGFFVPLM